MIVCPHCGAELSEARLLNVVFAAINRQDCIAVGDIRRAVVEMAPTDRQLFNALGYLTRKRKIRKLGYGRYGRVAHG